MLNQTRHKGTATIPLARQQRGRSEEREMKYIATLSGGKDSTAMVDMLLRYSHPLDYIVFKDTLHEFELMYRYGRAAI